MSTHLDLEQDTVRRLTEHCRAGRVDLALLVVLNAIHLTKICIMTALTDIQSSVDALTAASLANATKGDALLALTADISAQLTALQAGGGASADQLAALKQQIDAATGSINTEDTKIDTWLTSSPAPSPAPAPAAAADGGQPTS